MIEYALPDTVNGGKSAWREAMHTSAGTPLSIFTLLVSVLTLYSVSAPGGYLIPVLGSMLGWIIALGWWGLAVLASAIRPRPKVSRAWWKYLVIPLLLLMTVVVTTADLPTRVTFMIARPSMERIARVWLQSPDGATLTTDISIYGSCQLSHSGNAVSIMVDGTGYMDLYGFVYCPAGAPKISGKTTAIGGPWYFWYSKF